MLHFSRTLRMTTRVSTLGWSKSFSFAATRVQALVKMCVASLWADSLRTASRIESWAALWTLGDFMTIVMEILARDTASLRGQPVQTHPLVVVVLCVTMRGLLCVQVLVLLVDVGQADAVAQLEAECRIHRPLNKLSCSTFPAQKSCRLHSCMLPFRETP